jgi:hypothetical protein
VKFGAISKDTPALRAARKVGRSVMLPNREALAKLTGGTDTRQAIGDYAKLTPSGRNGLSSPGIEELSRKGVKI